MRFFFSKPKEEIGYQQPQSIEPSAKNLRCIVHTLSETGPVRGHNEDNILSYFFNDAADQLLCIVADGMGGHNAGEVASRIACDSILRYVSQNRGENRETILRNAILFAHQSILKAGDENPSQRGMGTTATTVLVKDGQLSFGHVGDSRLYQFSNGSLTQLSKDHTLVNQMYENGEISKQERDIHAMRNVLLQALGTAQNIQPQVSLNNISVQLNDKFLLCSDGLYDVFSDEQLQDLLSLKDHSLILECLRTIATERRASDNFSAILLSFSDDVLPTTPITKEQNIMS